MKTLYITFLPTQIDLRLSIQDGKVLGHLPNYMRVYDEPPVFQDTAMQLLTFKVPESNLHIVRDAGVDQIHIWAGDRGTRSNPQDLVRIEIVQVYNAASVPPPAPVPVDPVETAKIAFAGFPEDVRLAATLVAANAETLVSAGLSEALSLPLLTWANDVLTKFTATQP